MTDQEVTSVDSSSSADPGAAARTPFAAWIRVGGVAAASALAGGLAAAWFYRKTLRQLQQAEAGAENHDFHDLEDQDSP